MTMIRGFGSLGNSAMNSPMSNLALRIAWHLNLVMLGCVILAGMVVDGNGRIWGVSQHYSLAITLTLFVLGGVSALLVAIFAPKPWSRVVGGVSLAIYLILALPALL